MEGEGAPPPVDSTEGPVTTGTLPASPAPAYMGFACPSVRPPLSSFSHGFRQYNSLLLTGLRQLSRRFHDIIPTKSVNNPNSLLCSVISTFPFFIYLVV